MKHRCAGKLLIWAVLFVLAPVSLQAGKVRTVPPQTFQLSPGCSITSSDFTGVISFKGSRVYHTWRATWISTGCALPQYVAATIEYLESDKPKPRQKKWPYFPPGKVVFTGYFSVKVDKGKVKAAGHTEQIFTSTMVVIGFRRMTNIQLITKERYDAEAVARKDHHTID